MRSHQFGHWTFWGQKTFLSFTQFGKLWHHITQWSSKGGYVTLWDDIKAFCLSSKRFKWCDMIAHGPLTCWTEASLWLISCILLPCCSFLATMSCCDSVTALSTFLVWLINWAEATGQSEVSSKRKDSPSALLFSLLESSVLRVLSSMSCSLLTAPTTHQHRNQGLFPTINLFILFFQKFKSHYLNSF